ncbi:PIN domain-containing protein [Sporosarcina sp. ACRSL]|uniref:PIN domain-containing protein n=1 Tax=Sporosarcina sp. ACRSL TaxID=2918215 RepID=UPI001EF4E33D|nr:PIN domain-containing protein [Sporosarcina sp. ACRSL]MCG7344096.1 PIN domain-containing protein [Sporosarcina sp. ACRSL]
MQIIIDIIVVSFSFAVVAILACGYVYMIAHHLQTKEEENADKKYSSFEKVVFAAVCPETAFFRIFPSDGGVVLGLKGNLHIAFIFLHVYFLGNILYFLDKPIHWDTIGWIVAVTWALFFVASRVFGVYTMVKNLDFFKEQDALDEKINELTDLLKQMQKKQKSATEEILPFVKKKEKELRFVDAYQKRITEVKQVIREREAEIVYKLNVVKHNLTLIRGLDRDVEIAIDSNVLMKCDNYLVDAMQQRDILISKRVQQEWDKNKGSADQQKAFRARHAIRRLVNLENYRFVVSKWDTMFMKKNDLLSGVPDDEIIADYVYEQQRGKKVVVLSDDNNFIGSAKVHLPVLQLKEIDLFSSE